MAEINPNFDATDPANEFTQDRGDTSSTLNDVLSPRIRRLDVGRRGD